MRGKIIQKIMGVEGGYVNDPRDSGGATRYGITEAVARKHGYLGEMKDLPYEKAFEIYELDYWIPLRLFDIEQYSEAVSYKLMDIGVNMGVGRAAEYFQRSLNVLNNQGQYWEDTKVDGDIGEHTLKCFRGLRNKRGIGGFEVLIKMLNCLQGSKYIDLAEKRSKDEAFIYGWFQHRID